MRWSEAGYLSRIVLAHAPRQVAVSLIFDVRLIRTKSEEIEPMVAGRGRRRAEARLLSVQQSKE